jgi:hypothetical protein
MPNPSERFSMPAIIARPTAACKRIKCPVCGDTWLHQQDVEVFFRDKEYDERGLHATVAVEPECVFEDNNASLKVDSSMEGNPSPNRQGVIIKYKCENGNHTSWLHLYQHKGESFFVWVKKRGQLKRKGVVETDISTTPKTTI